MLGSTSLQTDGYKQAPLYFINTVTIIILRTQQKSAYETNPVNEMI
jgi:hypothetical protein